MFPNKIMGDPIFTGKLYGGDPDKSGEFKDSVG